jgi:imidazolonepropionase-like amidohydrolase
MKSLPFALAVGAAAFATVRPLPMHGQGVALTNISVIDVQTGATRPAQTIIIEGNRIVAISSAASARIPAGARTVEGRGKFVIPGLWDMHVHATGPGLDKLFLPMLVANGVTGVRDMFSRLSFYDSARAQSARGELTAPRIVGAGHILDGAPAIWPGSVTAANGDDAKRVIDSLVAGRAAFIKVYSRLDPETFRAIARHTRARGMPFAGHVPTLVSVDEALSLGMRSIEHVQTFTTACSSQDEAVRRELAAAVSSPKGWDSAGVVQRGQLERILAGFDAARCRALAKRVAASGTWMVPTVTVLRSTSHLNDTTQLKDERLKYIPKFFSNSWNPANDFRFRAVTPAGWAARRQAYDRQRDIVRLLHEEKALFLAGTDLANPYIFPGFSLHDELGHFVSLGFTPLEALQTATLNPARFLGATDSLGTVATGKVADLLVLDANPLESIGNVRRIHMVILNGRVIDQAERDRLFAEVAKLAGGSN